MPPGGADLHLHSTHSDGTLEPARLVELCAGLGLEAASLTDHDTVSGVEEAQETGRRLGIRVLSGVELSAEFRGHEIHLLGYGFDPRDPALLSALERYRGERERRAEGMVARLNALGVPLRLEQVSATAVGGALGRPHLADALLRGGMVSSFQEAFEKYLNPGRPAFVSRSRFSLEEAREVMEGAGGVLVLAHPHLNLSSANIRLLLEDGIDGLEAVHPMLKPSQRRELETLASGRGLPATGGSDCHGPGRGPLRVGSLRVPLETVDRINAERERLAAGGARVSGRQP
jgi:predicted metal-dependent phosphoesterase TrpH